MEQYHPIINLIYFCLVIGCSMVFLHPVCLLISITCAGCYTILLFGWHKSGKGFAGVAVLMLLTAIINPTFSHQGVTELAVLPSGNILTLESIYFGMAAAFMLGATLLWFRIVSEILTSDKIVYLFGKSFPVLGLLLSMILGFVPKIRRRYSEISMCRRVDHILNACDSRQESYEGTQSDIHKAASMREKGVYGLKGRIHNRIRIIEHNMKNVSILITWMLEDSVCMGDSMKGRGYGLLGRTQYTIYRFTKRDGKMLMFMFLAGSYVIIGSVRGALSWYYYPVTMGAGYEAYSVSIYIIYALLCAEPVIEEMSRRLGFKRRQFEN